MIPFKGVVPFFRSILVFFLSYFHIFFFFLFCVGVESANNVLVVSGEQQKGLNLTCTCICSDPCCGYAVCGY